MTNQHLGKYQILEEIGRGAFATVYKALDPELQREIALKVLDPRLARDEVFVERFLREARSAANLQHPNIVVVHEVGEVEGTYFIAMAYLPGPPLVELIANEAPVTVERAIELVSPIAEALDYAHSQGFIHRDVKPSNIILDARGQPVLTDFGLVRAGDVSSLSSLGMPIGTPYYMAPEQASGGPVNRRVDLYSLGVVLFEMLTGRVPFQADTPVAVLYQHVHETPPDLLTLDLGIPVPVAQVVKRALAKEPSSRYPSGKALIAALEDALAKPPSPEPAKPVRSREPAHEVEPTREVKSWTKLALVGCLTVLLCGIIGIGSWIEFWPKLFPQGTPTVAETGIPAPSVTPSPTPKQVKPTSITTPGPTETQVEEVGQTPTPSGGPTPSATATQTAVPLSQRPGRPAGEAYTDGAISVAADKELNVDSRYIYITLKIQNQADDKQLIRWRNAYLHLVDDKGRKDGSTIMPMKQKAATTWTNSSTLTVARRLRFEPLTMVVISMSRTDTLPS